MLFPFRQVRKTFLDLHTRRLNQWDGRKKVEPPAVDTSPATPTTPRTPATPTPVNDYAPNICNSGIVEPVPVSTVSLEGVRVGGDAEREVQVDYGSVRVMAGQSSSAFIPATAHQPQQQVQRALSLPAQQQQLGTVYMHACTMYIIYSVCA